MPAPKFDAATADEMAGLLYELSHNKETRKAIAAAVKKAKPDSRFAASFSDVDVEDRFEGFKAEQAQREIERQQQATLDRMNRQRARLLTGGEDGAGPKYSEEDVGKIEALMTKKGITDYDDGRILYASTLPPENPQPSTPLSGQPGATWEFPRWAEFGPDPVKASRNEANAVITEFMRARR